MDDAKPEAALQQIFLHFQAGRLSEAADGCNKLLATRPNWADALHLLGLIRQAQGNSSLAIELLSQAVRAAPNAAEFYNTLGTLLAHSDRFMEARTAFARATELQPGYREAWNNAGNVLHKLNQFPEAIACYKKALELSGGDARFRGNTAASLGSVLRSAGQYIDSLKYLRLALDNFPQDRRALTEEALVLGALGDAEGVMTRNRQLVSNGPTDPVAHSNLLFSMHYCPSVSRQQLFEAHLDWAHRHAEPLIDPKNTHDNDRDPNRRLRIGYVSCDFRFHIIGRLLIPLLRHHDKSAVEVYCYSNVQKADNYTERIKGFSDHWRNTNGMGDQQLAELIRQDRIDILFDPNGHIAGNRLLMFARKPAPIQVTHFGYPNTTGLRTMDYRFTDAMSEPFGEGDTVNTEVLVRLQDCWYCYLPDDPVPTPRPPPSASRGHVTFGCLNKLVKVSAPCLDLWAQILQTVPKSHLLLLADGLRSDHSSLLNAFARYGVPQDRIEFLGRQSHSGYMAAYDRIDIQLDPFPFNGDNTTCDGMWCGVPAVTLLGDRFVSRRGASHLRAIEMHDLVADQPEDYVEKAATLAESLTRLAEMRRTLRNRMTASPLCDSVRFARKIEESYRQMWLRWLSGNAQASWMQEVQGVNRMQCR